MSKEQIRLLQYCKLKKTIEYAWNNIPFYHDYWTKNGFEPSMFNSIADLKKIPFIDKDTVRSNSAQMYPRHYTGLLTKVTSGGTTGLPMEFYIDQNYAQAKELAYQFYCSRKYFGYKKLRSTSITLRGYHVSKKLLDKGVFWEKSVRDRGYIMSSFHLLNENYDSYYRKLTEYNPEYIIAYPSCVHVLCNLMKEHGHKVWSNLKGVICSSENVYNNQRTLVKDVLGVEIYSIYGHSEKSVEAYQIDHNRMSFMPLYGYTEFLNENNEDATNGELAEIVVSSLDNEYFPFIRYRTNDFVEVDEASSDANKIAKKIVGRAQEFVIDSEGNKVIFTNSDEALWGIKGIVAYQYVQKSPGKLLLKLEVNQSFDSSCIEQILEKEKMYYQNFTFEVTTVGKIEKTQAGKYRYLIQEIVDAGCIFPNQ